VPKRLTLLERFMAKVDLHGPIPAHAPELGPCWVWTAGRTGDGYGEIKVDGLVMLAHRVAWWLHHGELPRVGIEVAHRCDNPPCVRASHLFVATHQENLQDAARKGRLNNVRPRGDRGRFVGATS
jgi:hypothetical protein